jgi:hypothetical protein
MRIQKRLSLKNKALKLVSILLCIFILAGCRAKVEEKTETGITAEQGQQPAASGTGGNVQTLINDTVTYEKEDEYTAWQDQNPVFIKLSGSTASIEGTGAAARNGKVTITEPGIYVVSGKLDNGQIVIDSEQKGTVRLVLNGAEIQSSDNAPVYIKNADKTVISLEPGTENVIRDGENYVFPDGSTDEPNAALYSEDDLTINGSGSLKVFGNYNNGINVKDELIITGGLIAIRSVDDGLIGRDLTAVRDGALTIEAGGDAMKATNDEKADKGFVLIEGGTFHLTAGSDGIQAETSIVIKAGEFTISTGGGSINGRTVTKERFNPWGKGTSQTDTATDEADQTTSESAKGMKSASMIQITGGSLNIDASDDAIHSNGSIQIKGGSISAASGDDGIHADASIRIADGDITVTKSYEGIESSKIAVTGGNVQVYSRDDGFNAAGGNDGSSLGGRPGQNSFEPSVDAQISIDGGFVVVHADGDGLDSNGLMFMSDGTVLVHGPTNNGNGALDYGGTFEISGGVLIAAGSSGMAQAPGEGSKQVSLMMTYDSSQKAGTIVRVEDNTGKEVVTFAPEKDYQSVLISTPSLKKDGAYTLFTGGTAQGAKNGGLYTGAQYKDGVKVNSFTAANTVTWLNKDGVTEGGGGFNHGGGRMPGGPGGGRPGWGSGKTPEGMPQPGTMPGEQPGINPWNGTLPPELPDDMPQEQPDAITGATPEV